MDRTDFVLKFFHLLLVDFPTAAGWQAVAVVAIVAFKKQIGDFLGRAIEIGFKGAKAVAPIQQVPSAPQQAISDINSNPADALAKADPAIAEIETNISKLLTERGVDKLPISQQQGIFVREYAELALRLHFVSIGQQIFGSQLAALRALDEAPALSRDALDTIFKEHESRAAIDGFKDPNFLGWIGFLQDTKLVVLDAKGTYTITSMGRKFLKEFVPLASISESSRRL